MGLANNAKLLLYATVLLVCCWSFFLKFCCAAASTTVRRGKAVCQSRICRTQSQLVLFRVRYYFLFEFIYGIFLVCLVYSPQGRFLFATS